jgi:hypothetical protein
MKKVTLLALIFLTFSCKKETPPEPEPTPAPTPQVAVKISGAPFSCSGCISAYKSGGMYGVNVHMSNGIDRLLFSFSTYPKTGNYNFVAYGNPSFIYQKDNVYYRAVNGSINITGVDTSANGVINKLICTFQCNTDTTANVFFNFSEGVTNIQ